MVQKKSTYFEAHQVGRLLGHQGCVYTLIQGSAPHVIFSAGGDGMVARWNLQDLSHGQSIAQVPASIYALHYVAATDTLFIGQNFEGIYAIQVSEKKIIKALKLTAAAIFDLQTDPRTQYLWIACGDGTVIVLNTNYAIVAQFHFTEKSARAISFHPTLPQVAIAYSDCMIRVLDTHRFALLQAWQAHQNSVFTLQHLNETELLSAGRDAHLRKWRQEGEIYVPAEAVPAHLYTIHHMALSPDRRWVATAGLDKAIKIWRASDLKLLKVIDKSRHAGHGTSVNKLVWSSYQNWLVAGSDDRSLSVWELQPVHPLVY